MNALLHPRHWPVWIGMALVRVLTLFPRRIHAWVGSVLGALLKCASGSRLRVVKRNLELCFPDMEAVEREHLIDATYNSVGMLMFEAGLSWWAPMRRHSGWYEISGLEHLEKAREAGQGVLLLAAHMTHLELCGRLLAHHCPVPLAGLYRKHGNAALDWVVRRGRLSFAQGLFNRAETRQAVRFMRSGGMLWYAPDQDYERGESVFAPFFGIEASTTTSPMQLARLGRAQVMTMANRRLAGGRYQIEISPPLTDFPSDDEVRDCTRVNAAIEQAIRQAPDQYLWLHRRFKNRPEGEGSLY